MIRGDFVKVLDVILLKDGREATILEDYGVDYMVEVTDGYGRTVDNPIVSNEDIEKVVWEYKE